MIEPPTSAKPTHVAYGGRLLNLCMELAMLSAFSAPASAPAPRLRHLASQRYVRDRLDGGQGHRRHHHPQPQVEKGRESS
jgi:hypothetical protein